LALENARLLDEAQRRAAQEQSLSKLSAKYGPFRLILNHFTDRLRELHQLPNVAEVSAILSSPKSDRKDGLNPLIIDESFVKLTQIVEINYLTIKELGSESRKAGIARSRINLANRLSLSFIGLTTLVLLIGLTIAYFNFRNQFRSQLKQQLVDIVSVVALQQNGDAFINIHSPQDPAYKTIRQQKPQKFDPQIPI